jgi:hypothetical protein
MPNREEIQMQSGSKSERDRIEQGYDEFTHEATSFLLPGPQGSSPNCELKPRGSN